MRFLKFLSIPLRLLETRDYLPVGEEPDICIDDEPIAFMAGERIDYWPLSSKSAPFFVMLKIWKTFS